MDSSADRPQIGRLDVDPQALREPGAELGVVLATLGLDAAAAPPAETLMQGWRVLRDDPANGLVLGAPLDARARFWRIAQVSPERDGTSRRRVSIHPDTLPLRPSRAERSRGLELRWPDVTRSEPDIDGLAIDVVNTGEGRWKPNGDSFHVVGLIQRSGAADEGAFFAFVGGSDPAFALDPGEYARVRVTINANQWRDIEPGRYQLHAVMAELAVRAETPLELELTEAVIERHRPRNSPPSAPSSDPRPALQERLAMTRGLLDASERLGALVEIIAGAHSHDEARRGIQELLACSPSVADGVYFTQVRQFQADHLERLVVEADELEREMEHAATDEASINDPSKPG